MNKTDILDYIQSQPSPATKRDIARAFKLKGSGPRIALKQILKELESEGAIMRHPGGGYGMPEGLPRVSVIEVIDIDIDGDVFARAVDWNEELQGPCPRIEVMPDSKGRSAMGLKDRALARLTRIDAKTYEARVMKQLDHQENRVLGVIRRRKSGAALLPTDKKAKHEFDVPQADLGGADDGDLVIGEVQPSRGVRNDKVRVVEILGKRDNPKAISLISLHEAGIEEEFPRSVLQEADKLKPPGVKNRTDLRDIPLVTIDGVDARDFDDAVYAKRAQVNGGEGWHLVVAIADVAYYVRPGSKLDQEAQRRGNSTYFPDRVVPMLPEVLSNDLCSLRPNENRACMAMHMWIDEHGILAKHKIERGLMRSAARLTYEQVQAAYDGQTDELTAPLMKTVIEPLYEAYAALDQARQKRGALDLDIPEKQIIIDEKGNMTGVRQRQRLDSHKLIEEFMVLANVAAAQSLEAKDAPCVYRIHDSPSSEKLDSVREFLESFELNLPKAQTIRPAQLNALLRKAADNPYSHLVSTVILRAQSQAFYTPDNIGHFGLALKRYAHFTSPIRRYADLIVHRSLINAYGLGPGGLADFEDVQLEQTCQHISQTERTSMEAERNAVDRFTAAYLAARIGAEFSGKISGVTRFGLFVSLDETGADGLVPIRSLSGDYYVHDEKAHALVGKRHGTVFRLGAHVTVRIQEADGITGSSIFELVNADDGADIPGMAKPHSCAAGAETPRQDL